MRRLQTLSNIAFSPDGERVAYSTDASGQYNLWTQSVRGGWPSQLTTFEDRTVRWIRWLPSGDILFFADREGDEKYQLYRVPERGGWPERVTRDDHAQHFPGDLSRDGRLYSLSGNERSAADMDVMLYDTATGQTRVALAADGWFNGGWWSPDGRHLAVTQLVSNSDHHVHVLDVVSGEHRDLTPHDGEEHNLAVGFHRGGSGVYLVTDRGGSNAWLGLLRGGSREPEPIWRGEWDVETGALSDSGERLAWSVNEDGYSVVHVRDETTGRELALPDIPRGVVEDIALAPDGRRLALKLTTGARTSDIYVVDLDPSSLTQVTFSFLGGVPVEDLVEPEPIHVPGEGGPIPAWLYRPTQVSGKVPVVVFVHGGPEDQERPYYSGLYQYLLSRGVALLAPNIRGSTGYGREWQVAIHRDWMGVDLLDLRACAVYLHSLDWVDSEKRGVAGGSYGGYAALMCATRLPDHWAAAVDIVGPSDLVTFTKSVPPTWKRMLRDSIGDPETEAEMLLARSPITYVADMRCPLLVIQGANDPRVVRTESDQMVERLRARGHPVEYLVYPDEGHGFTKRANQLSASRATADFLLRQFGMGGVESA